MKMFIVAAAAWVVGAALGILLARATITRLQHRVKALRREVQGKAEKKRIGTMDMVLILEAVALVAYTVADMVVFWHTGAEPFTLTGCVFGVCGLENGVMGWIKTNKDKQAGAGQASAPEPPEPERPEPPDAGI